MSRAVWRYIINRGVTLNDMTRNILLWVALAGMLYMAAQYISPQQNTQQVEYSQFIRQVEQDKITSVTVDQYEITGVRADGSKFTTTKPPMFDQNLMPTLMQHNVNVKIGRAHV